MSEHPAVAFLLAAHRQADELARLISPGGYEPDTWHIEPSRSGRWVQIFSKSREIGEPPTAEERMDDQPVMLVRTGRAEHLHVVLHDPAAVARRVAAERKQLTEHRDEDGECRVCAGEFEIGTSTFLGHEPWPCRTVLLLAEGWGWEPPAPA